MHFHDDLQKFLILSACSLNRTQIACNGKEADGQGCNKI